MKRININTNKPNSEMEPLIAVKRNNIEHMAQTLELYHWSDVCYQGFVWRRTGHKSCFVLTSKTLNGSLVTGHWSGVCWWNVGRLPSFNWRAFIHQG